MLIQERFLAKSQKTARDGSKPSQTTKGRTVISLQVPEADSGFSEWHRGTEGDDCPRVVNAPLSFELWGLDPDHPYLKQRGLTPETVRHFGLGYCSHGLMAGRIAIPLYDTEGRLIGYAGRIVDDAGIGEDVPKYRLPGPREQDGTVYEFSKSAFLFNSHRIGVPVSDLIVVEGFFAVFHLYQCGYPNAVALMGNSCSPYQAQLLVWMTTPDGRIWLMPDGDKAGRHCAESTLPLLAPHRSVRWVVLDHGRDPNDCASAEFAERFGGGS